MSILLAMNRKTCVTVSILVNVKNNHVHEQFSASKCFRFLYTFLVNNVSLQWGPKGNNYHHSRVYHFKPTS